MSRFFSSRYQDLEPYVPGEQPQDRSYLKLNTNESPFPPAPGALTLAAEAAKRLQLYPDPEGMALRRKLAETFSLRPEELILVNGSDEALSFAFAAFCDDDTPAVYPDITYGFYSVFAAYYRVPSTVIPLKEDFSVDLEAMAKAKGTIFLANPNAPTGLYLPPSAIEKLLQSDKNRVVVVDEAYIDFAGESCIGLIRKYDNLLVVRTYSKSRSMAGARLGFAAGDPALMQDLNTLRCSTNPYNVDAMTLAAGLGALEEDEYNRKNCEIICATRAYLTEEMKKLGFSLTESRANFVFARHPKMSGRDLYLSLKERGILVRHFAAPRTEAYVRITIGTREQMDTLLSTLREGLEAI